MISTPKPLFTPCVNAATDNALLVGGSGGANRFTPGNKNFHRGESERERETEKLSNFPPFRRHRTRGGGDAMRPFGGEGD